MTASLFLAVTFFGALGAALRHGLSTVIRKLPVIRKRWWPVGTLFVNVTGSFAIALLAAVMAGPWQTVLTVGLLGGYTTFSAVSLETLELFQSQQLVRAAAYTFGTLVLSVSAVLLGLWVG